MKRFFALITVGLLTQQTLAQDGYGSPQSPLLAPSSSSSSSSFGGFSSDVIEFGGSPRLPALSGQNLITQNSNGFVPFTPNSGFSSRSSGSSTFTSSPSSSSSTFSNSGGFSNVLPTNSILPASSSSSSSFPISSSSLPISSSRQTSSPATFSSGSSNVISNSGFSSGNSVGGSSSGRLNDADSTPGGIDFSKATRQADGRLCVIKEESVETVSKDPILSCTHKNVEKCHYTYVTYFKSAQEEVCEENFEKKCQITFKQEATKEKVRKCYRPQEKNCNGQGPEECRTTYESSCTTRYIEKQPGKFVGDTACEKLPVKICGRGCVVTEGAEECHEKEIDSLIDVPEEVCDLNPQKTCRLQTKLVPSLKPKQECSTIPQEICSLNFSQPKRSKQPLRTEWCLDQAGGASAPASNNLPSYGGGNF